MVPYLSFLIKNWKEKGNSYQENEEIYGWKSHIKIRKFNWYISTITDVFLDQKKVIVCEHTVKTATRECLQSGTFPILSRGAIFTMYSYTFTLFWSRKYVIIEMFQLSFCVFMWAFHREISSFLWQEFLLSYPAFLLSIVDTFLSMWSFSFLILFILIQIYPCIFLL